MRLPLDDCIWAAMGLHLLPTQRAGIQRTMRLMLAVRGSEILQASRTRRQQDLGQFLVCHLTSHVTLSS